MKVGILTWYKSINHGAVLQAYASQQFLKENKIDSIMLDYNRNYHVMESGKEKLRRRIKNFNYNYFLMKTKIKKWNKEKTRLFKTFINEYINLGNNYSEYDNIETVMIGSDMVFDFFEGYNPFMYGKNVPSKKIFSYAACFGYTTKELFENYKNKNEIITQLNKLTTIGYRDDNTGDLLKKQCNVKKIEKNIDPVLLYGFDKERKEWNEHNWKNKKYILIYSYQSNMNNKKEIKSIRKFAKEEKLEIISVGYYHAWCNQNINADPKEFIELFANASYVVTDTFHGLVFSLTFNKLFAIITRNNSFKVLDLLKELNIEYDKDKNIYEKLSDIKAGQLNYELINLKINDLRNKSKRFLLKQVGDASDRK